MKPILIKKLLFISLFISTAFGIQKPIWVTNYGIDPKYSKSSYYFGYSVAEGTNQEARQRSSDDARYELASKLIVDIKGFTKSRVTESKVGIDEYFENVVESSSKLSLPATDMEFYVDHQAKVTHAYAFVEKNKLKDFYSKIIANQRETIANLARIAADNAESGQIIDAIERWLKVYSMFAEYKRISSISYLLGLSYDPIRQNGITLSLESINNEIEKLEKAPINSFAEAALLLIERLEKVSQGKLILISEPFTYGNSGLTSAFSIQLIKEIEIALAIQDSKLSIVQLKTAKESRVNPQALLTGWYVEQGNNLAISVYIVSTTTGKILSGAQVKIPLKLIERMGLSYKPRNFLQALADDRLLSEGELIDSELRLEAFLDKGRDRLIYTEGETPTIYVRVNRPVYLQIMYHLANGARTILLENYYISTVMVNHVIELPLSLEVVSPFGAETIQFTAQSKSFSPLQTRSVYFDNVLYTVIADDYKEYVSRTRGIRVKEREKDKMYSKEKYLQLVTIKR
jgi:hypothetical protein